MSVLWQCIDFAAASFAPNLPFLYMFAALPVLRRKAQGNNDDLRTMRAHQPHPTLATESAESTEDPTHSPQTPLSGVHPQQSNINQTPLA